MNKLLGLLQPLNLINKMSNRTLFVVVVVVFFLLGSMLGYSMSLGQQAEKMANIEIAVAKIAKEQPVKQVLGVKVTSHYVNPFDVIDAKKVEFPVAQLKGCRNWTECRTYCSHPENFQACVAWSKTQ